MPTRTALVVEDDKSIQELLRETLEGEGFAVTCEKDGEWALKALTRRLPDLLITDVLLPSLSGFDLVEALRELPGGESVPVVVMSGIYRGSRHHKEARKTLGVRGYLDKPFELSRLLALVRDIFGGRPSTEGASRGPRRSPAQKTLTEDDPLADPSQLRERDEVESQAKAFRGRRLARGNLRHKAFPEVLSQLYRWNETGALMLRKDRTKKIIYLKEGTPIFVKSNLLSECFGRVLVREKMITEEECEASLQKMNAAKAKGERRQQGTVLIEMGCISPHNLVYGLQLQLEAKLFEIFGWGDGEFQFNPKVEIPAQEVQLEMSLATMVYEGVRRKFSAKQIGDLLGPFESAYLQVHEDPLYRFQDIALEADERKFVSKIDGRKTLAQLAELGILEDERARQLLYALMACEMIQPKARAERKRDPLKIAGHGGASRAAKTPPPLRKKKSTSVVGEAPSGRLQPQALADLSVPELRKRLSGRMKAIRKQNAFEILGVSQEADANEIRRAYMALSRELHPDQMRESAPADARALAEQIQQQLTSAYETLSDKERRKDYEASLTVARRAGGDDVGRILSAEGHFRKGENALAAADFERAADAFQKAVDLYPEEGEFFAHLGWAKFRRAESDAERLDAENDMRAGIERNPRHYLCHLFLARALREMDREAEAVERFESALLCHPDCTEAAEALSLIRNRQRSTRGRP